AVLLVGLAATSIGPGSIRSVGLAAQAFALLGTLVGIFTVAIGVGPRTMPDVLYHVAIIVVLVSGLIVAMRAPFNEARRRALLRSEDARVGERRPSAPHTTTRRASRW